MKPDLLDDTPSSINFVSELLTSDKTIKSRSREENGESIEHSAKVKFTMLFHQPCNTIFVSDHNYSAISLIINRKLLSREIHAHKNKVYNTKESNVETANSFHLNILQFISLL